MRSECEKNLSSFGSASPDVLPLHFVAPSCNPWMSLGCRLDAREQLRPLDFELRWRDQALVEQFLELPDHSNR